MRSSCRREKQLPPAQAAHKIIPGAAGDEAEGDNILPRCPGGRFVEGAVSPGGKHARRFPFPDHAAHQFLRMAGVFRGHNLKRFPLRLPIGNKRRQDCFTRVLPAGCGVDNTHGFHVSSLLAPRGPHPRGVLKYW